MRSPQKPKRRTQTSRIFSLSAPVDGLNARDPLAKMKPTDALQLDNFFCTPYDVSVRKGYSISNAGAASDVNTLASYTSALGFSTLFAWASDKAYNLTTATIGTVGTPVLSGLSNSIFQTLTYGTSGGIFLVCVNGSDLPLVWNGTVWNNIQGAAFSTTVTSLTSVGLTATANMASPHLLSTGMSVTVTGYTPAGYNGTYVITVTGANTFTYTLAGALGVTTISGTIAPVVNLAITGVDPARFIHVAAFKSRLWFVEKQSQKVWYLPASSIGGAASAIDFTTLFTNGGYLMAMGNWSLDAGYGVDDYAVFVSSKGQAVVYKGTDPATAATWALVGVYNIGSPIGRRCFEKYAGDLTLINNDGLVLLSQALMSTRVNSKTVMTDKVQSAIGQDIANYSTNFGWQTILFPKENMLLLNVPVTISRSIQYVMNTISGAWSIYSNWDARCWCLHGDDIYFGGSNFVAKAWDTNADNGANINFEAQQSFNACGSLHNKKVNMIRPIISTDGQPTISIGINVDYDTSDPTGIPTFTPISTGAWDSSLWDTGLWAGDLSINKSWQTSFAIGYTLSPHLKGATRTYEVHWATTDLMIVDGGLL